MEDVGEMSDVELVVEVDGGLPELGHHFLVQQQGSFYYRRHRFTHIGFELLIEVSVEEGGVYGVEGVGLGEGNPQEPEVPLESRIHIKGACSWVHGGDVLGRKDIFEGQLLTVVPMRVV